MGTFRFKQFSVDDAGCAMKVGTDSVLLGAWTDVRNATQVVDLGAGSGLLSLMIAQRAPKALISALEVDTAACNAARSNIAASPWSGRIEVINADVMSYDFKKSVDLIISNPPYFSGGLVSPDAARATARTAMSFGPIAAIDIASRCLSPHGTLAMVTPYDMADEIIFEAEMRKMWPWRQCDVIQVEGRKPTRILWQIANKDAGRKFQKTSVIIRDVSGINPEFAYLTQDFYL